MDNTIIAAATRSPRIVVVEDDPETSELIGGYLASHGFDVETASDGVTMDQALKRRPADVIVLDIMLPGEDGFEICRRLGGGDVGIIFLSAIADVTDRIVGLELGADAYMVKPCEPRELIARIRALLRKRRRPAAASGTMLHFNGWSLNVERRELCAPGGAQVSLSASQILLLQHFVDRPQQVLSRAELAEAMFHENPMGGDRAVDVQISRLRKKLGDHKGEMILTLRGGGYLFQPEVTRR